MSTLGQQIDQLLQQLDRTVRQYELLVDRIAQLESRMKLIEDRQPSSIPYDGKQQTESVPLEDAKTTDLPGNDVVVPYPSSPQEQTLVSDIEPANVPAEESSFFALAQRENGQFVLVPLNEDAKNIAQFVVSPEGGRARVDFNNIFDYSSETLEIKLLDFVDYVIENNQCKELLQQEAGDARLENGLWILEKKVRLIIK